MFYVLFNPINNDWNLFYTIIDASLAILSCIWNMLLMLMTCIYFLLKIQGFFKSFVRVKVAWRKLFELVSTYCLNVE